MTHILLTGANGQVGWEVARRGGSRDLRITALDRSGLDIRNAAAIAAALDDVRPDVIVNAAAYTAVDKAEQDREAAFAVNALGPRLLALACESRNLPLIHISTDYVFDGAKDGPWDESDPTAPLGVYGESKLAGEDAIRTAMRRHVILRTAWVYGVHGNNFVKTMLRLAGERESLGVVDDQRGCPTYAADLAEAILTIAGRLAREPDAGCFGIFHCTNDGQTTWHGFARAIFDKARPIRMPNLRPIPTSDYPTPARRPANSVLDCSLIAQRHGLHLRPWQEALGEMLERLRRSSGRSADQDR